MTRPVEANVTDKVFTLPIEDEVSNANANVACSLALKKDNDNSVLSVFLNVWQQEKSSLVVHPQQNKPTEQSAKLASISYFQLVSISYCQLVIAGYFELARVSCLQVASISYRQLASISDSQLAE